MKTQIRRQQSRIKSYCVLEKNIPRIIAQIYFKKSSLSLKVVYAHY